MNNKIVVKHSSIIINDYEWDDCPKIQNIFSIYDKITFSYYNKGIEYIEDKKQLILPRGIDIFYLEGLFNCKATLDRKSDPKDNIDEVLIKYLPRDDEQKEALDFMIGISSCYKDNNKKSQLSVNLNTGKGKTYCSVSTIAYKRYRSAILTSSIGWLEQWRDNILEYTDIKPREIFFMSGSASIQSLLKKDINQFKIILISIATIRSYGDKYGWDKVTELFKFMKIGYKFYDEAHLNFDAMCKIDFYTNTYKTFYVTATPSRSDSDENRIYQLYFKNIPSIDLFDSDKDPHTNYISFRYKSKPTPQEKSDCAGRYGLDRNKYTDYITKNDNYYKMLTILLNLILKCNGKILVYIGTNNAIFKTKKWILENYPELRNDIGVYTSIVKENKEQQLENKLILSTTKSLGAAKDIKGLKMVIVLAEPFKSDVLARQTLGRTRDKDTLYIEVVDDSFPQITKYYLSKKPIFMKYALSYSEVVFKEDDLNFKYNSILAERKYSNPLINIIEKINNGFTYNTEYSNTGLKKIITKISV